jgi:hypothetical protein
LEQRHGPWITELQGRGVLAFDPLRLGDLFENGLPDPAVLSELLNLKESSVGLKAYGPQGGQVLESSADAEVVGIVDGRLSTPGPILLEVLLDLRVLVADMQRGVYAFRDEAAAEGPWGLPPISLFSLLFYDLLSITEEKGWAR